MNVKTAADLVCQGIKIQDCHAQASGWETLLQTVEIQLIDRLNLADPRTAYTKRDPSAGLKPQESTNVTVCLAELFLTSKRTEECRNAADRGSRTTAECSAES